MDPRIIHILICIFWGLFAGLLAAYAWDAMTKITYATLADGRKEVRQLPKLLQLVLPLTPNLNPYMRKPRFAHAKTKTDKKITTAGYDGVVLAEEFMSIRVLFPILFGLLWIGLVHGCLSSLDPSKIRDTMMARAPAIDILGILWGVIYPDAWLRRMITERHLSIQRALPFTLDLLTLSIEAGMDFMTALQRNVERGDPNPLNEEISRVVREIQVGRTRREALTDLMARVDQPDLNTVLSGLIQADELGVSIGTVLRIQADQMRSKRFERAEKLANEAPVKMLFPLTMFIFPCVFVILMGPFLGPMLEPMIAKIFA